MKVAQFAHDLGRNVRAVPGPVTSATSVGPHRLVREGNATLVTCAEDVLDQSDRGIQRANLR